MARYEFIAAYLLTNRKNGTLYAGSTSDLVQRMEQHKRGRGAIPGEVDMMIVPSGL